MALTIVQPPADRILNPSPKQRFMLSGDNVSKHKALVDSREFERGADFAMCQYQAAVGQQVTDGNSAMAAGFKLQGALEFLMTFRLLAETVRVPRPVTNDNLNQS